MSALPDLFLAPRSIYTVAIDDAVRSAAAAGAWFVFNLSGGKDSGALSFAANEYLDAIDHPRSRRFAIHANLGRAEWKSTPATVRAVASTLGLELVTVSRSAGDLVARWEVRFRNAKARYTALLTYNLIGPWSQANKRFCTSELKSQVIGPALAKRLRGQTIVQVMGIRREESSTRRMTPISKPDWRYASVDNAAGTRMLIWNPGVDWEEQEVFDCHAQHDIPLHEAYTIYGSSRLSCAFCVLASLRDLTAAASAADNVDLFRHLVRMEADSSFSFQPDRWLADVAPSLLTAGLALDIERAKARSAERRAIEAGMPPSLRYTKGWPPRVPDMTEATAIVEARRAILADHRMDEVYPTAHDVRGRFAQLIAEKRDREGA